MKIEIPEEFVEYNTGNNVAEMLNKQPVKQTEVTRKPLVSERQRRALQIGVKDVQRP